MKTELNPAYILHGRSYRETSLLLDVFSRDHGRVSLVAKGIRKKNSPRAEILQPFQRLLLAWSGKHELMNLTDAEMEGVQHILSGERLLTGFYLNELVIRLLHQGESHPELFDAYDRALVDLSRVEIMPATTIRYFEKSILESTGYGLILDHDSDTGAPIEADISYFYQADKGASRARPAGDDFVEISGRALIDLARGNLLNKNSLNQCKILMRYILHKHIGNKPLASRKLFRSYMDNQKLHA